MRGRGLVRRKMATSCRSTRSSTSLVTEVRPISRTSPSTCQKIKYSNRSDTPGSCPTSDHGWSGTPARLLAPHRPAPRRIRPARRDRQRRLRGIRRRVPRRHGDGAERTLNATHASSHPADQQSAVPTGQYLGSDDARVVVKRPRRHRPVLVASNGKRSRRAVQRMQSKGRP
jgi:hypothetical protein